MSIPAPIPTLPISSATASQAAHIASLTTQVHQLVDKNNTITAKLEQAQKDGRERLHAEVKRSDDIVRQMRDAHDEEMRRVNERMETLRISAVHAQQSMAYAHQVTKYELKSTENALSYQKNQNIIQAAALVRATGVEDLLQNRLVAIKSSHSRQVEALVAKLEQAQADLVAMQTHASEEDDKIVAKLKNQLQTVQASLTNSQEKLTSLENANAKLAVDVNTSEEGYGKLRSELKEEKNLRKEVERELREMKEQIAVRDSLETRDVDAAKQNKRRLRELEVALASEQTRVSELETAKAELEAERSAWRVERRKLEKEKEKLAASTSKDAEVPTKKATEKPKEPTKKKEKEESKEVKSKKRPRDDEDANDEGVIQVAFGKRVTQEEPKKHKKAKLDSDVEAPKAKPPKPVKATSTTSKPRKDPVTTKSKPPPSSPPVPSPSPMSTPQLSEEDEPVVVVKSKFKPAPAADTTRTVDTATKRKSKPPAPAKYDGGNDSDNLQTSRAKFFGGDTKKALKTDKKKEAKQVADSKKKGKAIPHEDEGEVFDLDAVSDATEDEEEEEEPKPKPKPKVDKPKPKPTKAADAGVDKPAIKKASSSKEKVSEVENMMPIKPKKKTFNLLGNMTNGTSLGSFGSWGGGLDKTYNIPSQLSSPEKGGPLVPRATFNFPRH